MSNLRSNLEQNHSKSGFTIVELLIVIVVIAILAAITVVAFNGLGGRADRSSMASDLNSTRKLVEAYRATNGELPTQISQLNEGSGFTPSKDSSVQYSTTSAASYCITIARHDKLMKYNSTSGAIEDGHCDGHGPLAPAQVAYYSGIISYGAGNTDNPLVPGTPLQSGDVLVVFHEDHGSGGASLLKIDGNNISSYIAKQRYIGTRWHRVSIVTEVTPATTIAFRTDYHGNSKMAYYILRGIKNPSTYTHQEAGWTNVTHSSGTSISIPESPSPLKAGQIAILGIDSSSTNIVYPESPSPGTSEWQIDEPISSSSGSIALANVIGSDSTPKISASVRSNSNNHIGAAIYIFGS